MTSTPSQAPRAIEPRPAEAFAYQRLRSLAEAPRQLGRFVATADGPTLVCLAGLHGNEPSGVLALDRVFAALEEDPRGMRGTLVGLVGNRRALAAARRFVSHDLNRAWTEARLARLRSADRARDAEDVEQMELQQVLSGIIEECPSRVFALDLHTTSGPGPAFAILDDTLPNREIALDFPVPLVLGLEEELSGTLASYLTSLGVTVVGFEAGQHEEAASIARAEAAIWLAMDSCGLIEPGARTEVEKARHLLQRESEGMPRVVEVRYRHKVRPGDGFEMAPGFRSFQPIGRGQALAVSLAGPILARRAGRLLMPLYQQQGEDGFFLVREVKPIWLTVSALVRRLQVERILHWLPGVAKHPAQPDCYTVDQRWARWLAPQLFHLVGFRREGKEGRILVMTRREDRYR